METKGLEKVWEYAIHFGIIGGSLGLVWFLIKKMVNDLSVDMKAAIVQINTEIGDLEDKVDKRFRDESKICRDIRGACMTEREELKKQHMTESMHKIVCKSTQNKLLLHISEENKKILEEIRDNKETVIGLINDLRNDLRKNGNLK